MANHKNKVLITGSSGMLGGYVTEKVKTQHDIELIEHTFSGKGNRCDFSNKESVLIFLDEFKPDCIVNLIGSISVDGCELNIEEAVKINVDTTRNIGHWVERNSCRLIHISTDHVYDSKNLNTLSNEKDFELLNNYAITKYLGERYILKAGGTVLRTNFVGKSKNPNKQSLTDWVYKICKSKEQNKILNDVFFSPLTMNQLSIYIKHVINFEKKCGVYNLGSKGCISKADFDIRFAEKLSLSTDNLTEISIENLKQLKAVRPKLMCMDSSLFENEFKIKLPTIEQVIDEVAGEYCEN